MLWNLGFNIALPTVVLIWGGSTLGWPPPVVLVVALLGPLAYGGWELATARTVNHVSILGVISVLATGGIGLLELDAGWVAVKEAAVPLVLGAIVVISAFTRWPVVKTFLFDADILDVPRIEEALEHRGGREALAADLKRATLGVSVSFLLSAILNYGLATWIVRSPTGTVAFNEELGRLTAWSFPVIAVPSALIMLAVMAWLLQRLRAHTGLSLEAMMGEEEDDEEDEDGHGGGLGGGDGTGVSRP